MFGKRRKAVLASATLVAGAMLMTACQDTDSADAQGTSSSAPSVKAATPSGSSTTGTNAGTNTGTNQGGGQATPEKTPAGKSSGANDTIGKCRTDDLKFKAVDHTVTGDSEGSVAVEFTNNSSHDCTMSGYAGVDVMTNAGSISAQRTGQQSDTTILKSGKSVAFAVTYPINTSGGSGVRVTGLVVTPPDETKSVTLTWPGNSSLPATDGPGSPVQVGPIGSAGQGG